MKHTIYPHNKKLLILGEELINFNYQYDLSRNLTQIDYITVVE